MTWGNLAEKTPSGILLFIPPGTLPDVLTVFIYAGSQNIWQREPGGRP